MNASTSLGDTPASTTPPSRRTVDAPTRMFHWLFALSFLGAYLTSDGERWRMLHITLGYTMAGLLAFRVLYGLWGPPQARLSLMLRKLKPGPQWLKSAAASASTGTWANFNRLAASTRWCPPTMFPVVWLTMMGSMRPNVVMPCIRRAICSSGILRGL